MREQKQRLRLESRLRRESLPAEELRKNSGLIQRSVLEFPPYRAARAIALYSPVGNEVATEAIRDDALASGKKLFYPRLGRDRRPEFVQIAGCDELRAGSFGILEPTGSRVLLAQDQERLVIFVPGLAFDLSGHRLGRGSGWYDRVLGTLGGGVARVALAYEFQVVETLPADEWDQRVRYIITERRVIDCGQNLPRRAGFRNR